MTSSEIETKLRSFLVDELAKEQAEFLSLEDELELDSLDQTELRGYLTEEFEFDASFDKVPPENLKSLSSIIGLIAPEGVAA